VSLGLHALLLILFSGLSWSSGAISGGGEAEVGIVAEDTTPGIESRGLPAIQTPAVSSPDSVDSLAVEQIHELGPLPEPQREALIGVDLAVGSNLEAMDADWAGFVTGGGGLGSGKASFFNIEASGERFVFVVDHSGSMNGAKLARAKSELIRSVRALDEQAEFYIIFYNDQFARMPADGLVQATEANKNEYLGWVERIAPGGGTEPQEAMKLALSLRPDAIYLLSDGLFAEEACGVIRGANPGARIQIHTIAFYDNAGEPVLRRIAEENRGIYRFVSAASLGLPSPGVRGRPVPRP
jgi:hypothetical protein